MEENSKISKNQEVPVEIKQSKDISENEQTEKEDINLFFKKTLRNTLSAFFLSMISAVINFFVNIPLLRKVSKESYGIVKVYFELAFTLVNFIPRESIRRASQKFCPDRDPKVEKNKFISSFSVGSFSVISFDCFISTGVSWFFDIFEFSSIDIINIKIIN